MASLRWQYDQRAKNYRDLTSGRFLSQQTILDLRNGLLEARVSGTQVLSAALADGRIDLVTWQSGMRAISRDTAMAEYLFGRGGINAMSPPDYGRVGALVKAQYQYLEGFATEVAAGSLSEKQVAARAAMYAHAGVTAHSVGKMATYGGQLNLPVHPGEGTDCKSRCKCHWSITEGPEAWVCTWIRESGRDGCDVCRSRASAYSPFVQSKLVLSEVA